MRRVRVVDDDSDLVDSLLDLMRIFRLSGLAAHSLAEVQSRASDALACDTALLDLNLGEGRPSGLDAYRWLRDHAFAGRIIFLTGHGQSHPLLAQARQLGDVDVFSKPLTTEQLRGLLSLS